MGKIRRLQYDDLEDILQWRNSESVRKSMFDTGVISWETHLAWFEKYRDSDEKILLVYEDDHELIGYISLTKLFSGKVAEWSFHVNPKAPRGSGKQTCQAAINYAFSNCGILKISAQVIASNEKSLALHRRLGFVEEGVLKRQYFDGNIYHDIVCFGKFQIGELIDV